MSNPKTGIRPISARCLALHPPANTQRRIVWTSAPLLIVWTSVRIMTIWKLESLPNTYAAFAHFIETTVDDARAVYILGDLFDYWVGDEMLSAPFAQQLSAQLR